MDDFNSRPSARGDWKGLRAVPPATNFNSRPSARGDGGCTRNHLFQGISIHAPPRGATIQKLRDAGSKPYFNSRPSARGDIDSLVYCAVHKDFNSRPSARGDNGALTSATVSTISIHAPPRGATSWQPNSATLKRFQFTPLREGRRRPVGKLGSED